MYASVSSCEGNGLTVFRYSNIPARASQKIFTQIFRNPGNRRLLAVVFLKYAAGLCVHYNSYYDGAVNIYYS